MLTRISILAWSLLYAAGVEADTIIKQGNGDIPMDSDVGRHLLSKARSLNQDYYNQDVSQIGPYSLKFQGCHHVSQWNDEAQEEDDIRIMTKRLVRFRLCPSTDCQSDLTGCTSSYGDYVVDMNTFLEAYMQSNNYEGNQANRKLEDFSVLDYLECGQLNMGGRKLDQNDAYAWGEENDYFLGPYCAEQGSEIRMGLFTDDTCTAFSQYGETRFASAYGITLPFSESSLVGMECKACTNGNYEVNEFCETLYAASGKCETKMSVNYPNESSCSYIEGIKIIREDGVIRTSATKKSKAAAICIGVFLTIAVLLAGYVYYLRTKLGRAKINLAAASQNLA